MRHQRHLRLARRAGREIQDRVCRTAGPPRADAPQPRDRARSRRGRVARSPSSDSAPSASPVSRIQCSTGAPRRDRSVLGSSTNTARAPDAASVFTRSVRRIARVHRGGDGPVRDDPEIGQIKFQARLGVERDHVAPADPERPQPGRDLLRRLLILVPRIGQVSRRRSAAAAPERRRIYGRFPRGPGRGCGRTLLQFSTGVVPCDPRCQERYLAGGGSEATIFGEQSANLSGLVSHPFDVALHPLHQGFEAHVAAAPREHRVHQC